MKRLFLFLILIAALPSFSLVVKLNFDEVISSADFVFYGRVENTKSYWEEGSIWTDINFKIFDVVKGHWLYENYKLKIEGGTVGEITQWVEDTPNFNKGEEYILFLKDGNIVGSFQGKIKVENRQVHFSCGKVEVEEFLKALKIKIQDPSYPIFSNFVKSKPVVSKVESGKKYLSSNFSQVIAKFSIGWFEDEVDYDGDGYKQFAKLYWDVDVSDKKSTLNVYEKVYWRATGDTGWVLFYVTDIRTIKGVESDGVYLAIEGASRGSYDFRIEVLREGQSSYDDFRDPSNNSYFSNVYFELPEEDSQGSGLMVYDIRPEKASAGTGTEVTIKGVGFENSQGAGNVKFFYKRDENTYQIIWITSPVISWKNNEIKCEVPVGTIQNYAASAGSGPVKITTNSGIENESYEYKISFSYMKSKWEGQNPVVEYYIGDNILNWKDAIQGAASTWSSLGNFSMVYKGTTSNQKLTQNGKSEVMYGNISDSTTIGHARCTTSGSKISECDLVLNSNLQWSIEDKTPSNAFDVQTIVLHEMGHWLALRDLYGEYDFEYDSQKVMYGYGGSGKNKRQLHPDDADGLLWIYGGLISPEPNFTWDPNLVENAREVSFFDLSKYGPSQWLWDFGDGETSTLQNPKHTFYFSGIHKVKLTVSNSYGTSEIVKNVVVLPRTKIPNLGSQKSYNFIIPASAKAIGQNQTNWLTDLSLYNPNGENIYVYGYFLKSGENNINSEGIEILIGPYKMHKFPDALYNLFSQENSFGGIFFTSDKPFMLTSRTYNDLGIQGTYGQFVPAVNINNFIVENENGYLLNLVQTSNFRTNVGFVNFSNTEASFNVSFYKEGGALIGTLPVSLKPFSHIQINSVISQLTSEEIESAYAIINQISSSAKIAGYLSVVDNNSSDPIFVPMKKISEIEGKKHQIVPIIARAKGAYQTDWRSDLKIFNPFQSQNVQFKFYTSSGVFEVSRNLPQNSLMSFNDVVSSLFPSAPENSSGSLHIYSDNGLFITSRTYNKVENNTYGQFIPGVPEENSLSGGETGLLLQLTYNQDYRCNVGFTQFSGVPSEVQVKIYDKNRVMLGFKNYSVGAFLNSQITNIFGDLNIKDYYNAAYIEIKILSGSSVYAYASVVDNRTGDSIFIPFLK